MWVVTNNHETINLSKFSRIQLSDTGVRVYADTTESYVGAIVIYCSHSIRESYKVYRYILDCLCKDKTCIYVSDAFLEESETNEE